MKLRTLLTLVSLLTVVFESKARGYFRSETHADARRAAQTATATQSPPVYAPTALIEAATVPPTVTSAPVCPALGPASVIYSGLGAMHTVSADGVLVAVSLAWDDEPTRSLTAITLPNRNVWLGSVQAATFGVQLDRAQPVAAGETVLILFNDWAPTPEYTLYLHWLDGCVSAARGNLFAPPTMTQTPTATPIPPDTATPPMPYPVSTPTAAYP